MGCTVSIPGSPVVLPTPPPHPFLLACQNGDLEGVKAFSANEEEITHLFTENMETGLYLACKGGHQDVVRYLLGHFSYQRDPQYPKISHVAFCFLNSCCQGQLEIVREFLNLKIKNSTVPYMVTRIALDNAFHERNYCPITCAMKGDHWAVVELLCAAPFPRPDDALFSLFEYLKLSPN